MAKRKKKLNKKLVIALSVITLLLLMLVGAGAYKYRYKLFPRDPAPHAKAGMDAFEKGQYELAEEELQIAIGAVGSGDAEARKTQAKYCYDLGKVYIEWYKNGKEQTDAQKRDHLLKCIGAMRQSATLDREYLEPRETLFSLHWQMAYGRMLQGQAGVDWTQFLETADSLISIDPDNATAYYRRGVAWGSVGEHTADIEASKKGIVDFRKAIELDGENVSYWRAWLVVLGRIEPRDPTVEVDAGFLEAFKANPNSAALRIMYASYLRRKERSDEAEAQLREAIKCEPTSPSGHIAMAKYLLGTEQYEEALKELDAAESIAPALADIYLQRSNIHRIGKNLDKSIKALKKGIAVLEPELSTVAATQPASMQTRALTEQMNRLNFALANTALDFRRTNPDKEQRLSLTTTAKECFDKLSNLPANSPHLAKLAGRLAVIRGDRKAAIENLEIAYKAFGLADLQTPALLITLYDSVGMPGKSEQLLMTLQNAPRLQDSVEVLLGLARLRIRYQDYEGADNFVNRALRSDPQNKAALQMKGELQILTGQQAPGVQIGMLSKAGIKAMVEQADLKWSEGQQKEALKMITGLRKSLSKDLMLAEREVNMHLMLGDKDSARKILTEMLVAYPKNENLKFQNALIDKNPAERFAMQIARVDEKITEPFQRAWTKMRIASSSGNKEMYSKFFAEAIALKSDDPGVVALQFRTALQTKNWDAALAVVDRIEKTDEKRGGLMRAQMFLLQGKHPKAIEVLIPLRKSNPDSKFVLRMLGECYLSTKDIELAKDVFGVLESNDPGDVNALIGLAIVTQNQGRMEENEKYVMRAYRRPAGRKHSYIARRYLEIRESQATGDEIKKIIERREKLHKLGSKDPNYLNNLSRLARLCEYRTRDLARAGELYRDAYEKTGRSLQWGRTLAFFYARNGDFAKGESILKAGLSEAKNTQAKVAWHIMHGEFLARIDPNQAMRAYDQAARLDPTNPTPLRAKATLYATLGKWPKAIENMTAYVAKHGEDIRGRKTLIQYRINGRQYDKAEKELETLLTRNPTDAQALLLKAVMFRLRGSPAKAVTIATQAIEKHPEFAGALSVRARAYRVMGELEMAKNDLETARSLSKTPQASMELADVYAQLGRNDDAILVLKSVVAEHATYEVALYKLINTYLQAKDWPNAESTLSDAQKSFPKKPNYWIMEAGMWRNREQNAKAISAYERAMALDKNSMQVVRAYLLGLLEGKAYDKALTVAESYKSKTIWSIWMNAIIGRIMVAQKQDSKANELFLKSVEKAKPNELPFVVTQIREAYGPKVAIARMQAWSKQRPAEWYVKVLVGDLCSAAVGDPKGKLTDAERTQYLKLAVDCYVESIKEAKKSEDVAMLSNRLGKVYYDLGEPREAEKAYKKCLEITPNDNAALNNLAYLYVDDVEEPEKALPYVQKVIKLRPQDPNVLDTYGWVMGKLKRYVEAKKYLQRSIERDPELAACRYHLGWVFEQTGNRKQALKHYRLGMELVRTAPHLSLYKRIQGALKRLGV